MISLILLLLRARELSLVKDRKGLMALILFFPRLSAIKLVKDCKGLISLISLLLRPIPIRLVKDYSGLRSLILLLSRVSSVRLESFRLAASHSVVPASFNITSTLCLASGLKEAFLRHLSPNVLFSGCVSAALADSPFPDNARSVKQVIAIKFCKFMCFFLTINVIILCL